MTTRTRREQQQEEEQQQQRQQLHWFTHQFTQYISLRL